MRVGIIAEGKSDLAVITNILKGKLGVDQSDISYLVPELEYDQTDLSQMRLEQFSNWTIVKQSCIDGGKISDFLESFEGERIIILQIDTAERPLKGYEVMKPAKKEDTQAFYEELIDNIRLKMHEWLNEKYQNNPQVILAIAIEEIEAWILTLYAQQNESDTGKYNKAKERLFKVLNQKLTGKKRKIFQNQDAYAQYYQLSKEFRKPKKLLQAIERNYSLKAFCDSLKPPTN